MVRHMMMRRVADGPRGVGWMSVIVVVACHAPLFWLCMIFSDLPSRGPVGPARAQAPAENRVPLFGIMHVGPPLSDIARILPPAG